ncbi:MAG TPA: ABC transporter permease [Candidatus Obscuribacterales bacterium]
MLEILTRRCLQAVPLLLVLSIVTFLAIQSLPGDPVDVMLGSAKRDIAADELEEMRHELGIDRPLVEQYFRWLSNCVLKGDWGRSYKDGRAVTKIVEERLPATFMLVGSALLLAFSLGVAWGLAMVWLKQYPAGHLFEALLFSLAITLYSAPGFWVGFLALAFVAKTNIHGGLPLLSVHAPGDNTTFLSGLFYALIPSTVLSLRRMAKVALFVRTSVLDELNRDYVVTALSKGLGQMTVLIKHVLRNGLSPVITLIGLSLPYLLGGSVLVESVFGWPGMGSLVVDATFGRNYPVILGLVTMYGSIVIFSNLLADSLQIALDPRLRQAGDETARSRAAESGGAF